VATGDESVADAATGPTAVPDTLDWFATVAGVTTLVTVQVNEAESEKPASSVAVSVTA